jgi:anti-anti-sigma regulatory factor
LLPAPADPPTVLLELHMVPPAADVRLTGEVDLHGIDQVRAVLETVQVCDVRELTVDLTATEFVSLGVLGELADVGRALAARGGKMLVVGARPVQRRVLALLEVPPEMVHSDPVPG